MGGVTFGQGTYLNVSMGKLINKKKNLAFDAWEGQLVGIHSFMDTYEGKPQRKWRLTMKDADGLTAIITFTHEAWYYHGFFKRILKVDVTKPFVLGVMQSDQNEKQSFCWMRQEGVKIEGDANFPKPKTVTVGNKAVSDWTEVNKAVDEAVKYLHISGVANTAHETDEAAPAGQQPPATGKKDELPF